MNFLNKKNPFIYGFVVSIAAFLIALLQPSGAPATVAVAFDTAGGTPVEMVTIPGGGKLDTLPTTSKTGYDFEHWLKGNDVVTLNTVFNANTTVRAVFEQIEFTITYEVNGGNDLEEEVVAYGDELRLPTPTKLNAVFQGWYEEPGFTTLVPETIEVLRDYTLYAKWSIVGQDVLSVSFFSEGLGLISTEYVAPNTSITLPTPPEREGYIFAFWINGITFNPVQTNTFMVTQDVVFFAEWNSVGGLVTITFDSQGGTPIAPIQVPVGSQWADPVEEPYLDEGYQFLSWITNCNFDGFEVSCTTLDETYTIQDDMTVLAKYDYMVPLANMRFESFERDSRVIGYELSSIEDFTAEEPISTLVLPAKYAGVPVVALGEDLFNGANYLDTVIIPEGVQYIQYNAFRDSSIKEVFLPDSLIEINGEAFFESTLETIHLSEDSELRFIKNSAFYGTNIDAFHAPKNLSYIGGEAFKESQLETFTTATPSKLAFIGNEAFMDTQLTAVSLPEGLKTIRHRAFSSIETLTELHIPASLKFFAGQVFEFTPITTMTFGNNSQLSKIGNYLFGEDLSQIPYVQNAESDFVIAGPILITYKGPLQDAAALQIPSQVKVISNNAFVTSTTILKSSLTFHEDLRFIGENAFGGAVIQSSITIPDGLYIDGYAFSGAQIQGDITIGAIDKIEYEAFNNVVADDVIFEPNPLGFQEYILDSNIFRNAAITTLTFGEGYYKLPYGFLQQSSVEVITIPDSVKVIESYAIGSASLTNIVFTGTSPIYNVSSYAVSNEAQNSPWYLNNAPYITLKNHLYKLDTRNLSNGAVLVIPEGITSAGYNLVESNWVSFESIDFNDVEYIQSGIFERWPYSLEINQPASFNQVSYFPGYIAYNNNFILENGVIDFKNNFAIDVEYLINRELSISNDLANYLQFDNQGFKILGNVLFQYDNNLDLTPLEITIPEEIEIIASSAFYDKAIPENFSFNEGLLMIEQNAFNEATFANTTLALPSTLQYIQSYAFSNSNIQAVDIPASVKRIQNYAFDIDSLRDVTFEDLLNISLYNDVFGDYTNRIRDLNPFFTSILENQMLIVDGLLIGYLGFQSNVVVPEGVIAIGSYAFSRRDSFVKSITLPSTLKVIHESAFGSCEYLTEIDFSQVVSLTYVGRYAFNYTAITHLVIETPITEMSPHALEDMPHLLSYEVNLVNPSIIILGDAYDLID